MKFPSLLKIEDALPLLAQVSIIDVRSPGEFAQDHIPGALNFPVLNDQERITVGTLYKQVGAFEAKKLGAALVSQNIASHLQQAWAAHPREWQPFLYCWRGGNRSGAAAHVLAKIGWPVLLLDGGYREHRRHVLASLPQLVAQLQFKVICGTTGSGKSRLLQALAQAGAQVLDLEQLALHRGSVLGFIPGTLQPSQKAFESAIWHKLHHFAPERPVYVEAESKKVGNLRVPEFLMQAMRDAHCIQLSLPHPLRVQLLMQDYAHLAQTPDVLCEQLSFLQQQHGRENIRHWQHLVQQGELAQLIEALLQGHYDPAYLRSIERNFSQYRQAQPISLNDITPTALEQCARELIATQ